MTPDTRLLDSVPAVRLPAGIMIKGVRVTVEMMPEHRARLLELATARSERGISVVVADAIELCLKVQGNRVAAIRNAVKLKGSVGEKDATELRARTRAIRDDRAGSTRSE
jgi:hypothetical protein